MGNTNRILITVNVDFTGVTWNSGKAEYEGSPTFTISPLSASVPPRPSSDWTNTLVWQLNPTNYSGLHSSIAFPATNAVQFSNTEFQPTLQPDGTYTCDDNFPDLTESEFFYYTVTITITRLGNPDWHASFTTDPDVENEAGTAGAAPSLTRATK